MELPDVNVLVYAAQTESPDHERYREWLHDLVNSPSAFGMSELVLAGFVRVVTNPRAFATPLSPGSAVAFVEQICSQPTCRVVRPGPRHLRLFLDLCRTLRLSSNDVPDAYHAALAIEGGNEWVTADRGFARYPHLRWRHPLDA